MYFNFFFLEFLFSFLVGYFVLFWGVLGGFLGFFCSLVDENLGFRRAGLVHISPLLYLGWDLAMKVRLSSALLLMLRVLSQSSSYFAM